MHERELLNGSLYIRCHLWRGFLTPSKTQMAFISHSFWGYLISHSGLSQKKRRCSRWMATLLHGKWTQIFQTKMNTRSAGRGWLWTLTAFYEARHCDLLSLPQTVGYKLWIHLDRWHHPLNLIGSLPPLLPPALGGWCKEPLRSRCVSCPHFTCYVFPSCI